MTDYKVQDLLFIPANGDGEKTATDMTIIGDVDMLDGFSIMHGCVPARSLLAPPTPMPMRPKRSMSSAVPLRWRSAAR